MCPEQRAFESAFCEGEPFICIFQAPDALSCLSCPHFAGIWCAAHGKHDDNNNFWSHLPPANETSHERPVVFFPPNFFISYSPSPTSHRDASTDQNNLLRTTIATTKIYPSRPSSTIHTSIKPQRSLSANIQSRDTLTPESLRGLSRPECHAFQRLPFAKASCPYARLLLGRVCQRGGREAGWLIKIWRLAFGMAGLRVMSW